MYKSKREYFFFVFFLFVTLSPCSASSTLRIVCGGGGVCLSHFSDSVANIFHIFLCELWCVSLSVCIRGIVGYTIHSICVAQFFMFLLLFGFFFLFLFEFSLAFFVVVLRSIFRMSFFYFIIIQSFCFVRKIVFLFLCARECVCAKQQPLNHNFLPLRFPLPAPPQFVYRIQNMIMHWIHSFLSFFCSLEQILISKFMPSCQVLTVGRKSTHTHTLAHPTIRPQIANKCQRRQK